jgi:Tol biopolymer transport system component
MYFTFFGCTIPPIHDTSNIVTEMQTRVPEVILTAPSFHTPTPFETQTLSFPTSTPLLVTPLPRLAFVIDATPFDPGTEPAIYTIRVDGTEFMRLVSDPANTCCPSWSPDGRYIAFLGHNPDELFYHLYILEFFTGEMEHVPIEHVGVYSWAPDSQRIAFTEEVPKMDFFSSYYPSKINIVDIPNHETYLLYDAPWAVTKMEWSTQGNEIAILAQEENGSQSLHVIDIAGNVDGLSLYPSAWYDIDWHPSNSQIAYSVEPRDILSNGLNGICIINSDGTNNRLLIETNGQTSNPQWSPTGEAIAYELSTPLASPIGIYLTYLETNITMLISPEGVQSLNPAWSTGGQYLAFISAIDVYETGYTLYIYSVEEQIARRLAEYLTADIISWQPSP